MAKTVTEKPSKVAKPKKSLLSMVAESSKKSTTKSAAANVETVDGKTTGKRKLSEDTAASEASKKSKKAAAGAEDENSESVRAKDEKPKKGKGKVVEVKQPEQSTSLKGKDEPKSKKSASAKSKAKDQSPPPEESDVEPGAAEEGEEDATSGAEEEVQMFGFSTDDEDSSDDEMNDEPDAVDVEKLPTIAKDDASVKRKLEKAKRKPVSNYTYHWSFMFSYAAQTQDRGVIYLGRIPHGFYEEQMKSYFKQFGDVTRLRLSRNKKVCVSDGHPHPWF